MIACSGLTRRFGEKVVVGAISFEVAPGSVYALLGPNGAGKSTTLKLLTGALRPSSGSVTVAGLDVAQGQNTSALKRCMGVLPEGLGLFDQLSVEEHLNLSGAMYGLAKHEIRQRTDQLLALLSLEEGRHALSSQCSQGMRKKTALAMALLHNPEVLFLDEPFEGLDPYSAESVGDLLGSLAERGKTILFTSHSLGHVERVASHCLLLQHGALVLDAPMESLPSDLRSLYFELAETSQSPELPWLGSRP